MVASNKDHLLEIGVIGEITHSSVEPLYTTGWEGTPFQGVGRGGIVYNLKPGDPCFGWAWGEKAEPGVSVDGIGNDNAKGSFRNFTCIGNTARVVNGEAKGATGVVIGKVGGHPGGVHHVLNYFDEETLSNLAIGDKVQVRSIGVGLKLTDYPEIRVVGLSPRLMEAMGFVEASDKLIVEVTKVIPAYMLGQGSGGSPSEASNWDIMTQSPDAIEKLNGLRIGDIVLLKDILSSWGRGYYEGASTVGVVSCGASERLGQGIGVTTLMTCQDNEIEARLNPKANITQYFGLRGG